MTDELPPEGFLMSAETACLFYEICIDHGITERVDKIALLRLLVADGMAKYLRSPKEFLADKRFIQIKQAPKSKETPLE